jgi:uncharacterized NAD(P)/FAD-binding protein YdhS
MLAAQLGRRGLTSIIIEKAGRAGEGTAFSTRETAHLLNVRTGVMSAWPDRLDDFDAWLTARGEATGGFVQRRLFGAYLKEQLAAAVGTGRVRLIDGEAVRAERSGDGWTVTLADGGTVQARQIALAQGNQPPAPLKIRGLEGSALVADDPWSDEGRLLAERAAAAQLPVLIVGTGLTMVDIVLTLEAAGHDAPVTAVSRRGLLPRGHVEAPAPALDGGEAPPGLCARWRWVRERIAAGDDWRTRVDSLRPRTAELWQGLSETDRRRFMRHARPWWDVHRHRIAPEVSQQLKERIARGRLDIMAGRIVRGDERGDERGGRALITIARRGGGETVREAGLVMNCTGPLHALSATCDPLLRQMQADGLIRPEPLGIGIDTDDRDAALGVEGVWAVGPLSKARRWEIIAVPDIRGQADAVASEIAKH